MPKNKLVVVALTYIFGIGNFLSRKICKILKIEKKKIVDLNENEIKNIQDELKKIKTEGELKREIFSNIKRLIEIKSYRGTRHVKFLPCRGQRTRNNSKTRRKRKKYFFVKNEKVL